MTLIKYTIMKIIITIIILMIVMKTNNKSKIKKKKNNRIQEMKVNNKINKNSWWIWNGWLILRWFYRGKHNKQRFRKI
jgi:uncharacterized membrane protein